MIPVTTIGVTVTQVSRADDFTITARSDVTLTTSAQQHLLQLPLPIPMPPEMITLYMCRGWRLRVMADPWYMEGKCELQHVDCHFMHSPQILV